MLLIQCQEHYDEVRAFAKSSGKNEAFREKIEYLRTYGQSETVRVRLMKDFSEHSFYFHIERLKTNQDGLPEWVFWMNGGLIYHQASGEWSVHT